MNMLLRAAVGEIVRSGYTLAMHISIGIRSIATLVAIALVVFIRPVRALADDAEGRATKVVSQMTLDEKISQMHGTQAKKLFRIVVGVPRLGIPDLLVTNGPAGFGPAGPGHSGPATALPAPISLAATWDLEASHTYGVIAGSEAADLGNTLLEAPDVNIARVPQNGRTFEAFGEDPFLAGQLAVANINGIQSQGIIANVKHYDANNQEDNRRSVDVKVDERTLREIYLPAFEASVKEGHVASLMAAYNRVNGAFCCENAPLLEDILKKEWGFSGFVTSDFGAVPSTEPSVMNGLDLEMPSGTYFGNALKAAVDAGKVPVSVIDQHLIRRFSTMMRVGVWDHPLQHKPIPAEENGKQALTLAEEGTVLLRNEGSLLPLNAGAIKSVALIGPFAKMAMTGGGGSSKVSPILQISPADGLQKRLGDGVNIIVLDGANTAAATSAAKEADVAIVMVGDRQAEGHDHSIGLADPQDALVEAVADANKKTIVVLKSGGPVLLPWVEKVPAIVEAWYPGEEDGAAVAAILMGDYNPAAKLPITFPKSIDDLPARTLGQYPGTGDPKAMTESYSEGVLVGYRWYDAKKIEPLFPFGFGLSYTRFAYRNLKLSSDSLSSSAAKLTANFDVENAGMRDGTEVAQVYVELPSLPGVEQPPRQLKGFTRLSVAAGKSVHASVALDARSFSYWDVSSHGWTIAPGNYSIEVGGSSRDLPLKTTLRIQ